MTKIFSFYGAKQVDPLGEEDEESAAAEYRDLEGGAKGKDGDAGRDNGAADSGGAGHAEEAVFVASIVTAVGICYVLLGSFYLPPEAGADGGGVIAIIGGVVLAVAVPVLAGSLIVCCRPCRRGSQAAAAAAAQG